MQIQKINLDFSQNYYKDIVVKQNDKDSRSVIITVTDNGTKFKLDSSVHMCNIRMLTPDGREIYNDATILSDGTVQIDFTEQMVLASGTADLEIEIIDSEKSISTMHLNVVIIAKVYPDDDIVASDEFNALTAALLKVQGGTSDGGSTIVPDGVTYVDFADLEETDIIPIERLNGITLYHTEDNKLMASWENNGTQEVQLNGEGGNVDVDVPTKVSELENDIGYITDDNLPKGIITFPTKVVDYINAIYEVANTVSQSAGRGEITKELHPYIIAYSYSNYYSYVYFAKSVEDYIDTEYIKVRNHTAIGIPNVNGKLDGSDLSDITNRIILGINDNEAKVLTVEAPENIIVIPSGSASTSPVYTNFDLYSIKSSATKDCYILSGSGEVIDYGIVGQHIITNGDGTVSFVDNGEASSSGFNDVYAEASINMGRKADTIVGKNSIAIGYNCEASGDYSYANGYDCVASGNYSHAEGWGCNATGENSHAEGNYTSASGRYSHSENANNWAEGEGSHTEGYCTKTTTTGIYAHAEGYNSQAQNHSSHAEGFDTRASGEHSHSEGLYTKAEGEASHVEGSYTIASNYASHAEGSSSKATAYGAHAEGMSTEASNSGAHAEGYGTVASGNVAHAEGSETIASGSESHAEGRSTIASGGAQHVQGKYNIEDTENKYAHIVGGGEYSERKNIHTLDWEGNAEFAGDVTDGNGDSIASVKALIQVGGATDEQIQSAVESYMSENPIEVSVDSDSMIKAVNHRGYSVGAPENTLPAYILSKKKGFEYAECDVAFTSDGVAVLLHDDTIDRTSNGSGNISNLTYNQLLGYDFGSWFSNDYIGTKIPTFEEFIKLCKHIDLHPYIELKSSGNYTREQIVSIVNMVKSMGMKGKVTYISFNSDFLGYVKDADATARLGYLSSTTNDSVLTTVTSLRTGSNEVYAGINYTSLTNEFISNCIVANIPLEIWTVNDAEYIKNMNDYISGVTSDSLIATDILRSEYIDSVGTIGFPTNENGTANHGVVGQFLVSNGDGTMSWASIEIAEGGVF